MAFEVIENCKKIYNKTSVSDMGVRVSARVISRPAKTGGGQARYIKVTIGAKLARAISLTQDKHNIRLAFGTEADAGKIHVSVDNATGGFPSKRDKSGNYSLSINKETADGLFALEFPEFAIDNIEAIRPANGQPPHFVFKASAPMLTVED